METGWWSPGRELGFEGLGTSVRMARTSTSACGWFEFGGLGFESSGWAEGCNQKVHWRYNRVEVDRWRRVVEISCLQLYMNRIKRVGRRDGWCTQLGEQGWSGSDGFRDLNQVAHFPDCCDS